MNKELMGQVYKQLDIFLQACMSNDDGAAMIIDESLSNIKKLFDDKTLNEGLEEFKKEFETSLIDIENNLVHDVKTHVDSLKGDILREYINQADTDAITAYDTFMDKVKTFIILYIKTVKV